MSSKMFRRPFTFAPSNPGRLKITLLYVVIKSHTQILFNINKNNPPLPVFFITMI
ncbi:hypothetical protein NEIFL0001_0021 [Neisseria flavescens SK114]|nr:hypothetical protein NEIFL0001_0021 [Neisseria flavescens SK114]